MHRVKKEDDVKNVINSEQSSSCKDLWIPAIIILTPIAINVAYFLGVDLPQNTWFRASDLLAYAGVCIFGWIVYRQNKQISKFSANLQSQNNDLQNLNNRLQAQNLQIASGARISDTFNYLECKEINFKYICGNFKRDVPILELELLHYIRDKELPVYTPDKEYRKTIIDDETSFFDIEFSGKSFRDIPIKKIGVSSVEFCKKRDWKYKSKPGDIYWFTVNKISRTWVNNDAANHVATFRCLLSGSRDLVLGSLNRRLEAKMNISYINILDVETKCSVTLLIKPHESGGKTSSSIKIDVEGEYLEVIDITMHSNTNLPMRSEENKGYDTKQDYNQRCQRK